MTDQRAKWMNDSWGSGTVSLGMLRVTLNRIGRNSRPGIGAMRLAHGRIVLKTVIAIACPSRLRSAVPVAVTGVVGAACALTPPTYARVRSASRPEGAPVR